MLIAAVILQPQISIPLIPAAKLGRITTWRETASFVSTYLPVELESSVKEVVSDVRPDGEYTITRTQGKTNVNWARELLMSPDASTTETYRITARGEIIEASGAATTNHWGTRMHDLETVIAPEKSVQTGDVWVHQFKANAATGAVAASGVYRLLSQDDSTCEFGLDVKETEGGAPATSSGKVQIRKSDGAVVSCELKLTNAAIPGIPGLANGTLRRIQR